MTQRVIFNPANFGNFVKIVVQDKIIREHSCNLRQTIKKKLYLCKKNFNNVNEYTIWNICRIECRRWQNRKRLP